MGVCLSSFLCVCSVTALVPDGGGKSECAGVFFSVIFGHSKVTYI